MNVINQTNQIAKVAINKSLLKEYTNNENKRIVYLDNNTEFQIQLFNHFTYTIGISFKFNDCYNDTNNLLVLRPGERVWLDRYLNDNKKLLFTTYEVNNSKPSLDAIKNNGKIEISIYKENDNKWYRYCYNNNNIYYDLGNYDLNNNIRYYNDRSYINGIKLNGIDSGMNYYNSNITAATLANYCTTTATSALSTSCADCNLELKACADTIETGRIEKGDYSNQKFSSINIDFENYPSLKEEIIILPSSQKPIFKKDIEKRYCSNCGRKINSKFKYCPYCGSKI